MEQVGLDAPHEALGARAAGVQIDRHLEPVFEKKLETHESGQCGRECEVHEYVEIMGTPPLLTARDPSPLSFPHGLV